MQSYEVTLAHYNMFVELCKYWQNCFGLHDFSINFVHEKLDEDDYAATNACGKDRTAVIALNVKWIVPVKNEVIHRVALHEIMHVLLTDLTDAAENRYTTEQQIITAEEAAVVRLERIVLLKTPNVLMSGDTVLYVI